MGSPFVAAWVLVAALLFLPGRALGTSWFEQLFGFAEVVGGADEWEATRRRFVWDPHSGKLTSKANERSFQAGHFSTPSLAELRARVDLHNATLRGTLRVSQVVSDVSELHVDPANAHAVFQAASQFNALEFVDETVTPEEGITRYQHDHTQGPACATACAAGTVVRNYFGVNGRGQTSAQQLNNLAGVERLLRNAEEHYFRVKGGYTLTSNADLGRLRLDAGLEDDIRAALRIGVQEDTEVTGSSFGARPHNGPRLLVSQAYCSAASVSYSGASKSAWEALATLILEGAYEATLYAAAENALRHPGVPSARRVFLTELGGGVFGNDMEWIVGAMRRAFAKFRGVGLDVRIVSFGQREPAFDSLVISK